MSGNQPLVARSSAASSVARASPPPRGRREHVSLADPPTPQALGGTAEDKRTQSGSAAAKKTPKAAVDLLHRRRVFKSL